MIRSFIAATIAAWAAPVFAAPSPEPIEVMVLGAYHFGNPGQDVNNIKVDSVLVPKRQRELAAVAQALMAFRPTKVMLEFVSEKPDLSVDRYAAFTPDTLASTADERVQIGFRVARLAGLPAVQGIDEQPKDGEPDYFPYDRLTAVAAKLGQGKVIEEASAPLTAGAKEFESIQGQRTVAQLLSRVNAASYVAADSGWYSKMLAIGDTDDQAGADLNAMWYLRNAKIFAKLMKAAKPGDRVVVVYGAGHSYWLRHFARETPGYRFVDPIPYLAKSR